MLSPKRYLFSKEKRHSNPYRVLLLLAFIIGGLFIMRSIGSGEIKPAFQPTATPTRIPNSYTAEGDTYFALGNLNAAIDAYKRALQLDMKNAIIWAQLARIQAYSANLLTTDMQRFERLKEAVASADEAVKLAPEDSTAHAIRAFVLDWYASNRLVNDKDKVITLNDAEQAAVRAISLDSQNDLAITYYAEVLIDQGKYAQAEQYLKPALERAPNLMDAHRVNALLLEIYKGKYLESIQEYERAAEIAPNLTFLYLQIGATYRYLGGTKIGDASVNYYDKALEVFEKAALLNDQLGIKDPNPYINIGKTYTQKGDFFVAGLNMKKALTLDPGSADVYGQLGIVYVKSRNYEGAIPALECATYGCDAQKSCDVRQCIEGKDPEIVIEPSPLTGNTLVYYYSLGSMLAGMHQPSNAYCNRALDVFDYVRTKYGNDPLVLSIIKDGESICSSFGISRNH